MRFVRAALVVATVALLPAAAYAACPLRLNYAAFNAVGSTHQYAEYVVHLTGDFAAAGTPLAVHISAGRDTGPSLRLDVDHVSPERDDRGSTANVMLLVIIPNGGIRWFHVDSIADAAGTSADCADSSRYILYGPLYEANAQFDDSAAWVAADATTIIQLADVKIAKRVYPRYPEAAEEQQIQGDVTVAATVDVEGTVTDVVVLNTSGSDLLDNSSIAAARATTYFPARLPPALGGNPVPVRIVIQDTFRLDQ